MNHLLLYNFDMITTSNDTVQYISLNVKLLEH